MRLFLGGVELFDKSRGGDETRHRYLTHSEWHTDSKFVGLLKVGYQIRQMNDVKCETFDLPEHTKGQDPSHSSHREAYLDVEQYDGKRVMEN